MFHNEKGLEMAWIWCSIKLILLLHQLTLLCQPILRGSFSLGQRLGTYR